MTLFQILQSIGLPCAYSHFTDKGRDKPKAPPYLVYIGEGQDDFTADNTYYWRRNRYRVEYYFIDKSEETEAKIEKALLDNGLLYDKSEDVYVEGEGVFVIYYNI